MAGNGAIALRYRDTIYPGVMIWALIAIAQGQAELMPVGAIAILGAAILGGAIAPIRISIESTVFFEVIA